MKHQIKLLAITLGVILAITASSPALVRRGGLAAPAAGEVRDELAAACTKLKASEVAWVTLTDEGDVDEQVDSYPAGTNLIVPLFQYTCVPKQVTIVTVFTFNGETVFTDKAPLKATNSKGTYTYSLGTEDDSPLDDGEWGVEFYNNKTLLTSGVVIVGEGEEGQASNTVSVEGTVKDKKTKKPVKGAVILILKPGIKVQKFLKGGQKDADVFTVAKTDSKGQFVLEDPLERETEYSIVVSAKGYKPIGLDGLTIDDEQPDPLQLNITLTK
jgi:hypothetical protein